MAVLDSRLLGLTALVTVAYQLTFFMVTYLCRFDTLTDFAGTTNFILLAALTLALGNLTTRGIILSAFVFVWGVRLCAFLLYRILDWGEDRRFDDKRNNVGQLAIFWAIQAVWCWTVSLPVTLTNASSLNPAVFQGWDYVGWFLFITGFLLESVSDVQKTVYKKKPESKGRWIDVGCWGWSRHPNYMGEIFLWWGIYLAAVPVLRGAEHCAILGPIFITFILLFVSGIPILEQNADKKHGMKEEYKAFKKATSVLLPIPPKLYVKFPESIKKSILLDWKLYNKDIQVSEGDNTTPPPAQEAPTEDTPISPV